MLLLMPVAIAIASMAFGWWGLFLGITLAFAAGALCLTDRPRRANSRPAM